VAGVVLSALWAFPVARVAAQPDSPAATAVQLVVSPELAAAQPAMLGTLIAALGSEVDVTHGPAAPGQAMLTVLVHPCRPGEGVFSLALIPGIPASDGLFSRELMAHLQTRQPVSFAYDGTPRADADVRTLTALLIAYATGQPATADDESATASLPESDPLLAFYRARRLHFAGDNSGALALLQAERDRFLTAGPDWTTLVLWNAATAEALALNFAFDRALIWDSHAIRVTAARTTRSADPLATPLLAELHLLRGQHRLYLYEWDAVLADYNSAITLVPDLPRAYYLRGLLYYTQNNQPAALADFTRFLDLNSDPDSPLLTRALGYAAELRARAATSAAN
jgi:tetratricopeptide (TPR) repeat protein